MGDPHPAGLAHRLEMTRLSDFQTSRRKVKTVS